MELPEILGWHSKVLKAIMRPIAHRDDSVAVMDASVALGKTI